MQSTGRRLEYRRRRHTLLRLRTRGFGCAYNGRLPCAWGAIKAVRALVRVPLDRRTPSVQSAIEQGAVFLLGRDPAVADYPAARGTSQQLVVQARLPVWLRCRRSAEPRCAV